MRLKDLLLVTNLTEKVSIVIPKGAQKHLRVCLKSYTHKSEIPEVDYKNCNYVIKEKTYSQMSYLELEDIINYQVIGVTTINNILTIAIQ